MKMDLLPTGLTSNHLFLGLLFAISTISVECMDIGYTSPSGDIFAELGKDGLTITCVVNNASLLREFPRVADYLVFHANSHPIQEKFIRKLNNTAIQVHFDANQLVKDDPFFECIFENRSHPNSEKDILVDANKVSVGTKPTHIDDFQCISLNNDNLTCTWSKPNFGTKTTYRLFYDTYSVVKKSEIRWCPTIQEDPKNEDAYLCFWGLNTFPTYRQVAPVLFFNLTGTNVFGTYTQRLTFDHFANVLPNAPEDLHVVNSTTNSLVIAWNISTTIQSLPKGLHARVMYLCKLGMNDWKVESLMHIQDKKQYFYNISSIPFAYNLCDIRVGLRPALATSDDFWSANASLAQHTLSKVPGVGPKLEMGSYAHINETSLRIYWQKVPVELSNGPNLRYNVSLINSSEIKRTVVIGEIRSNSVVVRNVDSSKEYTFAIWALNDKGPSDERALITIPRRIERPLRVKSLTKIVSSNNTINISWEPTPDARIETFTVFWCIDSLPTKEICNGNWNWTSVAFFENKLNMQFDTTMMANQTVHYHFAIAANSQSRSTGMMFTTCDKTGETADSVPTVILKQPTDVTSNSVKLTWDVGCANQGIVLFEIHYCQVTTKHCIDNQILEIDGNVTQFVVGNLAAYKTYKFGMLAIKEGNNRGMSSDNVSTTTMEGKPTVPLNVNTIEVTNSSVAFRWERPKETNGIIKYYEIEYSKNIPPLQIDPTMNYTLLNMMSYQFYNISLKACTTVCSEPVVIGQRTLMGYPSKVEQPKAPFVNDSGIQIEWRKPAQPRGPLSYYQLQVDDSHTVQLYNTSKTVYHFKCDQKNVYKIAVRAVNHDTVAQKTYIGPWSDNFEGSCHPGTPWLIPVIAVGALGALVMLWGGKKLYDCCYAMQDIDYKLPLGLVAPVESFECEAKSPLPPADEECLLKDGRASPKDIHADSSGCSSAPGSVVSESDATITGSSDSGMEQNELRKRSRTSSSTSLMRNIEGAGNGAHDSICSMSETDDGYPKVGLAPGFADALDPKSINLSVAPTKTTYVSYDNLISKPLQSTKADALTKPYVQLGETNLVKTVPDISSHLEVNDGRSYVSVGEMPGLNFKALKED